MVRKQGLLGVLKGFKEVAQGRKPLVADIRADRGFLLSCITAVLEFTNPSELEHKKRMNEIKVGELERAESWVKRKMPNGGFS